MGRPVAGAGSGRITLVAQIQGDGGQWGASREEGEESPAASQGLPPQVGLTPFCTDVLSEGLGSGARISKTEDTPAGGRRGSGPQKTSQGDASRAVQTALWPEGQTAQGTRESGSPLHYHCPLMAVKTRRPDSRSSEPQVGDREGRQRVRTRTMLNPPHLCVTSPDFPARQLLAG